MWGSPRSPKSASSRSTALAAPILARLRAWGAKSGTTLDVPRGVAQADLESVSIVWVVHGRLEVSSVGRWPEQGGRRSDSGDVQLCSGSCFGRRGNCRGPDAIRRSAPGPRTAASRAVDDTRSRYLVERHLPKDAFGGAPLCHKATVRQCAQGATQGIVVFPEGGAKIPKMVRQGLTNACRS